ncbi:MAG TPA: hypothetical protein VII61_15620 [Ktedonobacteraceae bacterium]
MHSPISKLVPLTEAEVRQLVDTWYALLDVHPPVAETLPLLADENLTMQLPETTLHGQADFLQWYEDVTHKFFNEIHTLKEVDISLQADHAEVQLIVNWQAHTWQAPAAKSQWIGFDATQRWLVERSEQTQQPIIVTYNVEKFIPMPGSSGI